MAHTLTNQSIHIKQNIEQILQNESTVQDAIKTLKNELPFFNEETLYNMITDLVKYDKNLSLIDNFKGDESDANSINTETENLIQSFEHDDVLQLRKTLMSDDEQNNEIETYENKTDKSLLISTDSAMHIGFKMDWMKICECISHEMWPKLSSIIKSIIREKNIDNYQINNENVKSIIGSLRARTIQIEAVQYLQQLIKRAIDF
eukprot:358506_1